jgi:quercetin dioxygenase-like cupin family protein
MKIKKLDDVPAVELKEYTNVRKQIVLGPQDGSREIVLRYFSLGPDGASPYHNHDFPHLVRIETGEGVVVDADGRETPLDVGDYVYVDNNEQHNFKNTGSGNFDFICIVPLRGEDPNARCAAGPDR